jgi:hypothetical protein
MRSRVALVPLALATLAAWCASSSGCGTDRPPATTTSAVVAGLVGGGGNVQVSAALREHCDIDPARIGAPPRFPFDADEILPPDRAVLDQLVACVTDGPLAGQRLEVTGPADPTPAGVPVLHPGSTRANAVASYLELSGVATAQVGESARGTGGTTASQDRHVVIDAR